MKNILLKAIIITVATTATPTRASMMCQHDWLAAWRAANTLQGSDNSQNNISYFHASTSNSVDGVWAVSATNGGAGRQAVSGISACRASSANASENNFLPGQFCWCRMTNPMVGSNWVFQNDMSTLGTCQIFCAQSCTASFRSNRTFRAAILTVP